MRPTVAGRRSGCCAGVSPSPRAPSGPVGLLRRVARRRALLKYLLSLLHAALLGFLRLAHGVVLLHLELLGLLLRLHLLLLRTQGLLLLHLLHLLSLLCLRLSGALLHLLLLAQAVALLHLLKLLCLLCLLCLLEALRLLQLELLLRLCLCGALLELELLLLRLLGLLQLPCLVELELLLARLEGRRRRSGWTPEAAEVPFAARRNRHGRCDLHLCDAVFGRAQEVAPGDRAAAEDVGRHHREGAGRVAVQVLGTCHLPLVRNGAIGLVDVALAGVVARPPGLARREREPAHAVAAADIGAAHEADQRRRIDGPRARPPRHPAPARADACPAAVVGRRKTPWRGIDPGPAPGRDVDPLAVAVGGPLGIHVARIPDVAVFGNVLPVAVVVELLVAEHLARDVARRDRLVLDAVALGHPALEGVVAGARRGAAHRRQVAP